MQTDPIEILLVEDNPDDIELTLLALKRGKLANKVQVVRDGEEALNLLFCRENYEARSFEAPPRVILLDLKLPKVDGLEVLRQLKNDVRTRSIPVVVMTSSKEQRDMIDGYQLGVNSYIQKPVDFQEFREIVTKLGFYWLVINQSPPRDAYTPRKL
jgi:two-component system, response regulator